MKRLTLLCCWLTTCATLAAPIPKPKPNFGGGWDRPIDPTKSCKFTFTDNSLVIEAPGRFLEVGPGLKVMGAPRLLRSVKGDFVAQVRVHGTFSPSPLPGDRTSGRVSAGLIALDDKDRPTLGYRVSVGAVGGARPRSPWQPFTTALWANKNGGREQSLPPRDRMAITKCVTGERSLRVYMRIERRKGVLYARVSADGKDWSATEDLVLPSDRYPDELKVGVALFSISALPLKVTFDQWKLMPTKAEGKRS